MTTTVTPTCHVLAELEAMERKRQTDREVRRCIALRAEIRSSSKLDLSTKEFLNQEWVILTQLHPQQALVLMQAWRWTASYALAGHSVFVDVHPDICLD